MQIDQIRAAGTQQAALAEPLGRVVAVTGAQATVRLPGLSERPVAPEARATVGKFLALHSANAVLVGVVTNISAQAPGAAGTSAAQVDMLGEIKRGPQGQPYFQRGVTEYPMIGDPADLIGGEELRIVFGASGPNTITIGQLQQDASISAFINVDDMLCKHFAVFGTTGVGKSSGVALILRQVIEARPDLRIFLIDPHNEYGRCFDDAALVLSPGNLKLPFWLFNFEETIDVFFRGRPGVEEEVEILSEVIPTAKALCTSARSDQLSLRRSDPKTTGFTVDTPVPYRLADLVSLINERMGKLENRAAWPKYHRLIARIETVRNDPRYAFMFDNANVGGDTMVDVVSQLFRLPANGRPMTIMQLAGFPAEVVDSVVSVLCRMAFEFGLWSDGAVPLLFMCEEAHRYAPADRSVGFGPTRKAISRIAKEGRKYGIFLGLVTQRPAELDATIISQCSTLFAMRLANERDQAIVRSAVSDAAASLIAFVPSLGTREVFAFGEAVALPTRLRFGELPAHLIPKSEAVARGRMDAARGIDKEFIASAVERWRGAATMAQKMRLDGEADDFEMVAAEEFSTVSQSLGAEREYIAPLARVSTAPAPRPVVAPTEIRSDSAAGGGSQAFHAELQELRKRLRNRGAP